MSNYWSAYGVRLQRDRLFLEYANQYCNKHPKVKDNFQEFINDFQPSDEMLQELVKLAESKSIKFDKEGFEKDKQFITLRVKAEMAQIYWNNRDDYYQVLVRGDKQVTEAQKLFDQACLIAGLEPMPRR